MTNLRPHLFLLGANLIYGTNYTIAKIAMPEYIGPFGLVVMRVVVALLLFTAWDKLTRGKGEKIQREDWPRLIACGLFGVAINQLMFLHGLSQTSEIHAALLMITAPILVLMIARIILKEPITSRKAMGIVLGGAGVSWLIVQGGVSSRSASVIGDVFILINAASYGLYLVLVKPLMARYHPITVIKWVFFFGMFVVVPVGTPQLLQVEFAQLPGFAILSIAFVVVFTTFLAYLLNTMAIKDVSPSVVSTWIYTQPLIASLIAIGTGKDVLSLPMLVSGALIVAGVALVSYSPAPKAEGVSN